MAERLGDVIVGVALAVIVIVIVLAFTAPGLLIAGILPREDIRNLAKNFLIYAINWQKKGFWVSSPEVVTSGVWDFRGLDTLFETAVFYLAIIGSTSVFRLLETKLHEEKKGKELGLSIIAKVGARIMVILIIVASISIAVHGHLTPGGGFQGGSAFAVAPLLLIAAFSRVLLDKLGFTKEKMLGTRVIGLLVIALVALIPVTLGGLVMQNQPKPWSIFSGYPVGILEPFLWISGSLFFYNIAEFLAVGAGFTILFILLSLPEELYRKDLERGGVSG